MRGLVPGIHVFIHVPEDVDGRVTPGHDEGKDPQMDAAGMRAMQAPIKERYKADPTAGLITLKAKGAIDDANIACKVETGRALAGSLCPGAGQGRLHHSGQERGWSSPGTHQPASGQ